MGYDISQAKHERLERNRRDGRLCRGATRARGGCANRATVKQEQESWPYRIGEGARSVHEMTVCARHVMPDGHQGVNFRVLATRSY